MDYSAFEGDIILDCPGVPQPVVTRAIREAVRTFCKQSTAYRKKLTSSDLTYSSGVYTITVPANTQIDTVISPIVFAGAYTVYTFSNGTTSVSPTPPGGTTLVSTETYNLNPLGVRGASPEWLDINYAGWRSYVAYDEVDFFVMQSYNTFVLTPDSGTDRKTNLTVSLILMPDRVTTTLDDDFGNRWFDIISAGAKYLLMLIPEVEWTNPALSQFYKQKFDAGIVEAKAYAKSGVRDARADGITHVRGWYK